MAKATERGPEKGAAREIAAGAAKGPAKGTILIVEDDPLQRRLVRENLEQEGYAVFDTATGREALGLAGSYAFDVAVVDYKLQNETGVEVIRDLLRENPLLTPIVVTAFANVENAVEAMKQGAYDYITKPIDFDRFLAAVGRAIERQRLRREVESLRSSLEERFSARNFVFSSPAMGEVARLMAKAAGSDATVLVSGETGTGKDLVAKTIHYSSRRKDGPFLAVNIPSLPETLIEAELFGAEKLLRVLQDREFFRLGSSKPLRADVRIIAATNRDLEKAMAEEKFRPDLYYRLNVIHITVPPLRSRKEDVPPLVDHFIAKYAPREGKTIAGISQEAMAALLRYPFPGNIRELENVIERAVVFADGEMVTLADLPVFLKERKEEDLASEDMSLTEKVRRVETREIKRALIEAGGVKSRAARLLGITERMLAYKIKTYGIQLPPPDAS